jgi:predicted protein tyrosine phosphatase
VKTRQTYQGKKINLLVLSRAHVSLEEHTPLEPHILISITDPHFGEPRVDCGEAILSTSEQRKDVLRLSFFDISETIGNTTPISTSQAEEIFQFVSKWKDEVGLIVVHCEAGISRSAGVAAALSKWLNGDDMFFFETYCPNNLVYTRVLHAIYGDPWAQK